MPSAFAFSRRSQRRAPDDDFGLKGDPEGDVDSAADLAHEFDDIGGLAAGGSDDEVGVLLRDLRVADDSAN